MSTQAPPIILKPHSTHQDAFQTLDGVHRARAAHLRGETHIQAYVHQPMIKSEELIKAPIDYDTGETAQSWQEYPRSSKREELHRVMIHPGKHHDRVAMIKGLGQETQKKKIDGVWNLKLYRGVSEGEYPDDYKQEAKSFTSNKEAAQEFATKYGGDVVEQWIPAAHISYSFNHAKLADGPEHTENAHEHEVIVGPKHGE